MKAAYQAKASEILQAFENKGARRIEADILQPAGTLLDLYGEDIRARAYVTQDALRGEQMLRPDFTVPVVQMHMDGGAEPARYTYAGKVFRSQDKDPARASEYLQVGYEVFDRSNVAQADAEVFALLADQLMALDLTPMTGDISLLMAAVRGLKTSEDRKVALLRHIWRPNRFKTLLDRFSGRSAVLSHRMALLAQADPLATAGPMIGLRSKTQIEARIAALQDDAKTSPISAEEVALIEALLEVNDKLPQAQARLAEIAGDLPSIGAALEIMVARCEALATQGIDVDAVPFDAGFGRASMEYYDGFVFGFSVPNAPDLPFVASGGRYDALCERLGRGRSIPAVGGVIRPGLMVDLLEGTMPC